MNIKINNKKSYIVPFKRCFCYCQWRYKILKSGKIIIKPSMRTIKRQRRKIRKLKEINVPIDEINATINSYRAYLELGNIKNNYF